MKKGGEDFGGLTRREFLSLSGLGMAGLSFITFPPQGEAQDKKPKYGGRLRVAERYGSTGLDAHKNQFFMDSQNYILMYNALTIMGPLPQVRIYPDLAKSWEISPGGRDYTFSLREGVIFHHGKELDSRDVKYSIERVMNPAIRSPRAFAYRWIDSVDIIDKYHLKIRLKESFGPFLTTLTIENCPIIPTGWEPTGTKPAPGTGPFVLKTFVTNETTEFSRFDKYWEIDEKTGDRLPYLDSIYVKKIVDPTVCWTALRTGEMDYSNSISPKNAIEGIKNPISGIVVIMAQPVGNMWIFFNVIKPPFNNKKVRQAIAYAIDKNDLIKASQWGLGEPVNNQPFLNRSRMYIAVEDRAADLTKAKQLLAEAGYPNGFKTELFQFSGAAYYLDAAEVIMGKLKEIGIEASMRVVDRAAHNKSMRNGEYSISVYGTSERYDPDDAYYMYLHSSEIGSNNWSRYSNKELDDLLEKGRTTWRWEDRVPVYQKVVEMIKEDLPHLYLMKMIIPVAHRDLVKGFDAGFSTKFGYYGGGFKKVWLEK